MPLPAPAPVLIVDDDELIRGILRARLQRLSIPVMVAASAEEALATMEMTRLGAMVLDLHMPGQSGIALAEFVRLFGSHLTDVPILIFTGATLTPDTLALARRFNADVFQKPDGLPALLQRILALTNPANQIVRTERTGSGSAQAGFDDVLGDYREPES
jgi:DNA-binding response OmpR family regulator